MVVMKKEELEREFKRGFNLGISTAYLSLGHFLPGIDAVTALSK